MGNVQKDQFIANIKQYERLIFSICLSFTKNYFDAEDLAQETFLAANRNIDKFDGTNFKAWITTIAANKCRDFLRSPARNICNFTEEDLNCLESSSSSPEEIIVEADTKERVRKLCFKLKEPYKSISLCYFFENRKLSEVAKDTGQSLKTLQTQLYRAKGFLRILWKEETI